MGEEYSEVRILVEQRAARAKRIVARWISLDGRKKMVKIKSVVSLNRNGVGNHSNSSAARPVRFTDSVLAGHQMRKAILKNQNNIISNNNDNKSIKGTCDSEDSEEERLLKSKRRK